MPTAEELVPTLQIIISCLLYDRENETEVRTAFATLVQERHHRFHDLEGDLTTDFTECSNDICIQALGILQSARQSKIEINDFSVAQIEKYKLRIRKAERTCEAFLEERSLAENIPMQGVSVLE